MSDAKTPRCDNLNVYKIHELAQRGVDNVNRYLARFQNCDIEMKNKKGTT